MATVKISAMSAITAGNFDDTALFEVVDKTGATTKGTIAQTRTALLLSTVAVATPSAYTVTTMQLFASTTLGASLGGYGTTYDVSLRNRAGTVVLGVGPNSTAVTLAGTVGMGALAVSAAADGDVFTATHAGSQTAHIYIDAANIAFMTGASASGQGLLANATAAQIWIGGTGRVSFNDGNTTLGRSAGTDTVIIDGTGFGAGVASLRLNGLTTAATNNLLGTLANSPVTGNPTFWMPVSIAGVVKYIPCF